MRNCHCEQVAGRNPARLDYEVTMISSADTFPNGSPSKKTMRSRWRFSWILLVVLALSAPARAETVTAASRLPSGLGVHVQVWHTQAADLERIKAFGFQFLRWGMSWEAIEKSPGEYDWSEPDAFFEKIRRAGLPSIVVLGTGNPLYGRWLQLPREPGVRETRVAAPPESNAAMTAFSRFAAAAAKRYAYHPVTWEIWNEPDLPIFWPPRPHPDSYAQLVSLTCSAIKTAVPNATVLAPSTAAQPISAPGFYRAIAESEASGCLDGLSMHSYRMQGGKEPDPESVQADNVASRALLERISPRWAAVPVLCTEWGYPSSVVGPKTQSAYLVRAYLANLVSGVTATIWYEWKDSRDEVANPESHFGLQTNEGAFKTEPDQGLIHKLLAMRFIRRLESGNPLVQALLFDEGGSDHVVAWVRSDDPDLTVHAFMGGKPIVLSNSPTIWTGDRIEVSDNAR